jgi:nucleotide-binding universal stress UspA family protein
MKALLPLDGSESSQKTLGWVVDFLNPRRTELYLLNAYHCTPEGGYRYPSVEESESILTQATRLLEAHGFRIVRRESVLGGTSALICDYADKHDLDVIIMGSHGGGLSRMMIGSVSKGVLRCAEKPVVIVKNTPDEQLQIVGAEALGIKQDSLSIKNVLLPINDSDLSWEMLTRLPAFLEPGQVRIHLVHVIHSGAYGGVLPSDMEAGEQMVLQAASRLKHAGYWIGKTFVTAGDPAAGICDYANKNNIDQIILASQSKKGFLNRIFGGVSDRVFAQARQPVVVFRLGGESSTVEISRRSGIGLSEES